MSETLNLPTSSSEKINRPTLLVLGAAGASLLVTFCLLIWATSSVSGFRTQTAQINDQLAKQGLLLADLQARSGDSEQAQRIATSIIQQLRAEQTAVQMASQTQTSTSTPGASGSTPGMSDAATSSAPADSLVAKKSAKPKSLASGKKRSRHHT